MSKKCFFFKIVRVDWIFNDPNFKNPVLRLIEFDQNFKKWSLFWPPPSRFWFSKNSIFSNQTIILAHDYDFFGHFVQFFHKIWAFFSFFSQILSKKWTKIGFPRRQRSILRSISFLKFVGAWKQKGKVKIQNLKRTNKIEAWWLYIGSKVCFGGIPMIKIVPLLRIKFCQITFVPSYMSSLFSQIDKLKLFCPQKFLKIILTFRIDFRFWFEKCKLIISNWKNYWNFGGFVLELIRTSKQSNVLFISWLWNASKNFYNGRKKNSFVGPKFFQFWIKFWSKNKLHFFSHRAHFIESMNTFRRY